MCKDEKPTPDTESKLLVAKIREQERTRARNELMNGLYDLLETEKAPVAEWWIHPGDRGVEPLYLPDERCILRQQGVPFAQCCWEANRRQIDTFWTAEEVQTDGDVREIARAVDAAERAEQTGEPIPDGVLTPAQLECVYAFLAFFAGSDFIVAANNARLQTIVKNTEFVTVMATFGFMENIHSDAYSRLVEALVPAARQQEILRAVYDRPTVSSMAKWAQKWMNSAAYPLAEQIMAFVIVEGVFFSGPFCVFFWLKKQGHLLTGACKVNEFIAGDEAGHADYGCHVLNDHIVNRPTTERAHQMFREGTNLAEALVVDAIPVPDLGINAGTMVQYIRYVADYWLVQTGYPKLYHATQPFDFIKSMCDFNRDQKSNFFEDANNRAYRSAPGCDTPVGECSFSGEGVEF